MSKMSAGDIIGAAVGLAVVGVKLAKKLTEAKAANRRKDLNDSLRKSEDITADVEEEKQEDQKSHRDSDFTEMIDCGKERNCHGEEFFLSS